MKSTVSSAIITRRVREEMRSVFRVRSVGVLLAMSNRKGILRSKVGVSIIGSILQEGLPVRDATPAWFKGMVMFLKGNASSVTMSLSY
jgi:hypothetical protein